MLLHIFEAAKEIARPHGLVDTGPARVTLFVDNVTNSDALTTGFRFGRVALVGLPQSRQFGARASYKF